MIADDLARAREIVAAHKNLCVQQEVRRILDPHRPAWPQLDFAVPLWSNGRTTLQSHVKPGPGWFRVFVGVKSAA